MTLRELTIKNYQEALPYLASLSFKHRYFRDLYHALTGKNLDKQMTEEIKNSILDQVKRIVDNLKTAEDYSKYDDATKKLMTITFHKVPAGPLPPFPAGIAIISSHFLYGNMALVVVCEEKDAEGIEAVLVDKVLELVDGQWIDKGEYVSNCPNC